MNLNSSTVAVYLDITNPEEKELLDQYCRLKRTPDQVLRESLNHIIKTETGVQLVIPISKRYKKGEWYE